MRKLKWNKSENIIQNDSIDVPNFVYRAIYEKNFTLEYKKFKRRVWGSEKLRTGVQWRFSISPLVGERKEGYKYQLLISGLSGINGHIYIYTVDEGKNISEEIVEFFIDKFKTIK